MSQELARKENSVGQYLIPLMITIVTWTQILKVFYKHNEESCPTPILTACQPRESP
jgi:hypothetical protein